MVVVEQLGLEDEGKKDGRGMFGGGKAGRIAEILTTP